MALNRQPWLNHDRRLSDKTAHRIEDFGGMMHGMQYNARLLTLTFQIPVSVKTVQRTQTVWTAHTYTDDNPAQIIYDFDPKVHGWTLQGEDPLNLYGKTHTRWKDILNNLFEITSIAADEALLLAADPSAWRGRVATLSMLPPMREES